MKTFYSLTHCFLNFVFLVSLKLEGAGGGTGVENTSPSHGAEIQASFNLSAGDLLFILVGQKGEDACDDAGSVSIEDLHVSRLPIGFLGFKVLDFSVEEPN